MKYQLSYIIKKVELQVHFQERGVHFAQAVENSNLHLFQHDIKVITKEKGFRNTVFG